MEGPVHSPEFVPGYSSFLFNQLLQHQYYTTSPNPPLSPPLSPHQPLGISLNINHITFNTNNSTTIQEYTFIHGDNNKVCLNIAGASVLSQNIPQPGAKGQEEERAEDRGEERGEEEGTYVPKAMDADEEIEDGMAKMKVDDDHTMSDAPTPDGSSSTPPLTPLTTPLTPKCTPTPTSPKCTPTSPKYTPTPTPNGDNDDSTPLPKFTIPTVYTSTLFRTLISQTPHQDCVLVNTILSNTTITTIEPNIYPAINLLDFYGEQELVKKNRRRLQGMLYANRLHSAVLKMYTRKFLPAELRPMVWQILFNYLPEEKLRREGVLLFKQNKYMEMLAMAQSKSHDDLIGLIDMDVLRTMPEGYEQLFGNATVKASLSRVLLVWALQHPATGYFQGLNDLATPFFASFLSWPSTFQVGQPQFFDFIEDADPNDTWRRSDPDAGFTEGLLQRVEADVYWCLCTVLDTLEHLNAGSKCGVHAEAMMTKLEKLIKRIDAPLEEHMREQNIEFVHFAFPWMLCLFVRELSLDLVMVLWDFYASCEGGLQFGFSTMHIYVCAAFLEKFRFEILNMEFPDMLKFLHHPPTQDWTTRDVYDLIEKAKDLYSRLPM